MGSGSGNNGLGRDGLELQGIRQEIDGTKKSIEGLSNAVATLNKNSTIKLKTNASDVAENTSKATEALKQYNETVKQKNNIPKYLQSQEQAAESLKKTWNKLAGAVQEAFANKTISKDMDFEEIFNNENNSKIKAAAGELLRYGNAYEALLKVYGKTGSIGDISKPISDFISKLRELDNYRSNFKENKNGKLTEHNGWYAAYSVDALEKALGLLHQIREEGGKIENIEFGNFEPVVNQITELLSLEYKIGEAAQAQSSETREGAEQVAEAYEEETKSVEKVKQKLLSLEELRARIRNGKKSSFYEWEEKGILSQYEIDTEQEKVKQYSQIVSKLKDKRDEALENIKRYHDRIVQINNGEREDGKGIRSKSNYQDMLRYYINHYKEFEAQLDYFEQARKKAIQDYTPASGDEANEKNVQAMTEMVKLLIERFEELIGIVQKYDETVKEASSDSEKLSTTKLSLVDDNTQEFIYTLLTLLSDIRDAITKVDDNNGFATIFDSVKSANEQMDSMVAKLNTISRKLNDANFSKTVVDDSSLLLSKLVDTKNDKAAQRALEKSWKDYNRIMDLFAKNPDKGQSAFARMAYNSYGFKNKFSSTGLEELYSKEAINGLSTTEEKLKRIEEFIALIKEMSSSLGQGYNMLGKNFSGGFWSQMEELTSGFNKNATKRTKDLRNAQKKNIEKQISETVDTDEFASDNPYKLINKQLSEMKELLSSALSLKEKLATTDSGEIITEEQSALDKVKESVVEVRGEVDKKTEAFKSESATVAKVIPEETGYIGKLVSALVQIQERLENIIGLIPKMDFSGVNTSLPTNFTSLDLASFKDQLTSLPFEATQDELLQLYDYFDLFVKEVNALQFNGSMTDFLNQIKGIVDQGQALENFAKVLNSSVSQIQNAAKVVNNPASMIQNPAIASSIANTLKPSDYNTEIEFFEDELYEIAKVKGEIANVNIISDEESNVLRGTLSYVDKETKRVYEEVYALKKLFDEDGNPMLNGDGTQETSFELVSKKYSDKAIDRIEAERKANKKKNEELARSNKYLLDTEQKLEEIRQSYIKGGTSQKYIKDSEDLIELERQHTNIEEEISRLKSKNVALTTEEKAELNNLIDKLKLQVKIARNNEYAPTDMTPKDLAASIEQADKKYEKLVSDMKYAGEYTSELVTKTEEFKAKLQSVGSSTELKELTDQYKLLMSEFQALKSSNRIVEAEEKATQAAQESAQEKKEATEKENRALLEQINTLGELKQKWIDAETAAILGKGGKNENALSQAAEDARSEFEKLQEEIEETFNELLKNKDAKFTPSDWDEFYGKYLIGKGKVGQIDTASSKAMAEFADKYSSSFDKMATKLKEVSGSARYVQDVKDAADALYDRIAKAKQLDIIDPESAEKAEKEFNEIRKSFENLSKQFNDPNYLLGNADTINKLRAKVAKTMAENTAMDPSLMNEFKAFQAQLKAMADAGQQNKLVTKKQAEAYNELIARMHEAGKVGLSTWDSIKKRIESINKSFIGMFFSFYDLIRYLREAATTVVEFNDALTEMRKVSDETVASLKRYQATTFKTADAIGTTALDLQKATADWMRLGESMKEASKSAEDATILKNVSEFDSIENATTALVAMSQAYSELDKMDIIDVLDNIGNRYSIATDQLAQALQDAGAVLKTQGNDLNEAVALITAGNAITQDASKTAGGIRTIALRVASTEEAKAELEELGEEVEDYVVMTAAKKQQIIKDYTSVASNAGKGVDILDPNGNLKDTYEILLEISKVYAEIQEEDKKYGTNRAQALVEELAGKNRSNIAASILQNPQMLEDVYNSALDSAGAATKENEAYLESLSAKIEQFKNAIDELEYDILDSDLLKFFVDFGTGAVHAIDGIVDAIGPLTALLGAGGIFASAKNFGKPKSWFQNKNVLKMPSDTRVLMVGHEFTYV